MILLKLDYVEAYADANFHMINVIHSTTILVFIEYARLIHQFHMLNMIWVAISYKHVGKVGGMESG